MKKISKKVAAIGAAATLILAGGGYVATAAIPDSTTGEITGCRTTGDAGQVRIIDKEAGKSCHAYETEVSWPSEAGDYAPKLYEQLYAAPSGAHAARDFDCPAGEKLVSAQAGERINFSNSWPGGGHNGGYHTGYDIRPYEYKTDANGTLTGVQFWMKASTNYSVALVCSE